MKKIFNFLMVCAICLSFTIWIIPSAVSKTKTSPRFDTYPDLSHIKKIVEDIENSKTADAWFTHELKNFDPESFKKELLRTVPSAILETMVAQPLLQHIDCTKKLTLKYYGNRVITYDQFKKTALGFVGDCIADFIQKNPISFNQSCHVDLIAKTQPNDKNKNNLALVKFNATFTNILSKKACECISTTLPSVFKIALLQPQKNEQYFENFGQECLQKQRITKQEIEQLTNALVLLKQELTPHTVSTDPEREKFCILSAMEAQIASDTITLQQFMQILKSREQQIKPCMNKTSNLGQ